MACELVARVVSVKVPQVDRLVIRSRRKVIGVGRKGQPIDRETVVLEALEETRIRNLNHGRSKVRRWWPKVLLGVAQLVTTGQREMSEA